MDLQDWFPFGVSNPRIDKVGKMGIAHHSHSSAYLFFFWLFVLRSGFIYLYYNQICKAGHLPDEILGGEQTI